MLKNRIMQETRKRKYAIGKVCFQSHVNTRKCCLPCDVLLNCCTELLENIQGNSWVQCSNFSSTGQMRVYRDTEDHQCISYIKNRIHKKIVSRYYM